MTRALNWLLPFLVAVAFVLARIAGWGGRGVALAAAGVEVAVLAFAAWRAGVAVRRYRRDRAAGLDLRAAIEEGLATVLPRPAARFAVQEGRLWLCLARWPRRRGGPGAGEFGYRRRSALGTFLLVALLSAPIEIGAFELLIPWAWARWALLAASLYAVLWLLGLHVSLTVLPHRLEPDGLRLRYGLLAEVFLRYDTIASVAAERRAWPGGGEGLRVLPARRGKDGTDYLPTALLLCGGKTDLTIRLREPRALDGFLGPTAPVLAIAAAADDPERLAADLTARLAAAPQPPALSAPPPEPLSTGPLRHLSESPPLPEWRGSRG
ncbi:MAG TPA: hypothetical protein VFW96_07695 [Thermomicrobiales bacterium]|nr:hypothetical protein [Thermomicrobiales bacterium]